MEALLDEAMVRDALREIIDPELRANIVDLGFVRSIAVEDGKVGIELVLTVPGCPLSGWIVGQVRRAVEALPGVERVEVRLLDQPWTTDDIDWAAWVR